MFGDSNPPSTVAAAEGASSGNTETVAVWAVILIVIGGCCCLCLCFVALCVCCDSTRSMDGHALQENVSTQHQLNMNSSATTTDADADGEEAGVEMTGGHALPTQGGGTAGGDVTVDGQDTN